MRFLGSVTLVLAMAASGAADAGAQSWRTVTMSRQKAGEKALDVRISYGAGRFIVRPAEGGLLYRMELRYDEDRFEPRADYDGRELRLGVSGTGRDVRIGKDNAGEMTVALARGVAMDLRMEFGAVEADVDLGGLSLSSVEIKTGASETRIDVSRPNPLSMEHATIEVGAAQFTARRLGNLNARNLHVSAGVGDVTLELTGAWHTDADVSVKMGLGSLQLRFPEGLGVRLRKKTFLTALDAQGLVKRGDDYYSPDWETATRRITVQVEAAFGSIDVDWVR